MPVEWCLLLSVSQKELGIRAYLLWTRKNGRIVRIADNLLERLQSGRTKLAMPVIDTIVYL